MTTNSPKVKNLIKAWQSELRILTGNKNIELFAAERPSLRKLSDVQRAVAEATEVDLFRVLQPNRKQEIVFARRILCYCMRRMCNMSYPAIADAIGYSDHTSAMHSENEVIERLENGERGTGNLCSNPKD